MNEGWCVDKYMFIISLSHLGMALLLLGVQVIDIKMGTG